MKKIFVLCFIMFYMISCSMPNKIYTMFDDFEYELGDCDNLNDIFKWVENSIIEKLDIDVHGKLDYWQTPNETIKLGSGDCEDISILIIGLAYYNLGIECNMLLVNTENDLKVNHAVSTYGYKIYDNYGWGIHNFNGYYGRIIRKINFRFIEAQKNYYNSLKR